MATTTKRKGDPVILDHPSEIVDRAPTRYADDPPKKRGDVIRIRLECSSATPGVRSIDEQPACDFKTRLYPERERAGARKELAEHAVAKHSTERRVKIVTERREEAVL
jgi:hypothetical protein